MAYLEAQIGKQVESTPADRCTLDLQPRTPITKKQEAVGSRVKSEDPMAAQELIFSIHCAQSDVLSSWWGCAWRALTVAGQLNDVETTSCRQQQQRQ